MYVIEYAYYVNAFRFRSSFFSTNFINENQFEKSESIKGSKQRSG